MVEVQGIESSFVTPCWFKRGQKGREHDDEVLWFSWQCLRRILEVTPRDKFEWIIVDNASDSFSTKDDDGIELSTEEYFKHADVLIMHEKNLGYGGGMNAGISVAKGKYVFCLENDVLPFPGWYEAMIGAFSDPLLKNKIGLVQPWSIACRGMRRALTIQYDDPNLVYKGRRMYEWGKEWGAVHATPRELFEHLKERDGYYFDPRFGIGMKEDKDLYKRIRLFGKETCRTYKAVVYHNNQTSYSKLTGVKQLHEENKRKFKEKWNQS